MRRTPPRHSSASRRGPRERARDPVAAPAPSPPLPITHPATVVAATVAAACILLAVTFRIIDTDFWQHLAVGRALWTTRAIPHTDVWSWPSWGEPGILRSWGFRALLWPFWRLGELDGLFAWRWLTTALAFGLAWATARRMGARGLSALVVMVLCALVYRQRSQVRPETLAAVLLALTLWLLARGRRGSEGATVRWGAAWVVPVVWLWANVHISYLLAFVLLGIRIVAAHVEAWRAERRGTGSPGPAFLWGVALACAAAALLNPFGWRALWQPFEYLLDWRGTALVQGIGELRAVGWSGNETNGAFLLLVGWPLLILWRAGRAGVDVAEIMTCVFFTAYALPSQRFLAVYALAAAPYVARDLEDWIAGRRWPRWTVAPAARGAIASAVCLAIAAPEILRPDSPMRPGVGMDATRYPIAACDFIARHDLRGRIFNQGRTAGYLLWRFWPERDRLPFVTIHLEDASPEIRALYAAVFTDAARWSDADARFRFDMVLLDRRQYGTDRLYDRLDADTSWALVFADDAAVLYLRRAGPLAAAAERLAYRVVPAGRDGLAALRARWSGDASSRERARTELERQASETPYHAGAASLLADLALAEGRLSDARAELRRALAVDATFPHAHERLGLVALFEQDAAGALAEFERERRVVGDSAPLQIQMGFARESAGDRRGARRHYRAALRIDPANARARQMLDALGRD